MDTRIILVLFALLALSFAGSFKSRENKYKRVKEVPCNLAAIAELQRLGLEVHNARCYPSNYARGLKREAGMVLERRSCCGPECEWLIADAGVDPATVSCPRDD